MDTGAYIHSNHFLLGMPRRGGVARRDLVCVDRVIMNVYAKFGSLGPTVCHEMIFGIFSLTCPQEEVWLCDLNFLAKIYP